MKKVLLLLIAGNFLACTATKTNTQQATTPSLVVSGKLWGSLFQQKSAEYAALCYQAFNAARLSLDQALATGDSAKPPAIITDVDETFLDNSPYAVHQALLGLDYETASWNTWTAKGTASALPGSYDFFSYAASRGVAVFYITNRGENERVGTLANIKRQNFPFADDEHLLLLKEGNPKEMRRELVAEKYRIILLLGDNLADFSTLWDKKDPAERMQRVTDQSQLFGTRFIILPNSTYGGWEEAIYGNKRGLTPAQKDSAIKANLTGY